MELFQWDKNFETGLATVDEQHRALLALTNRLGVFIQEGEAPGPSTFERMFSELEDYASRHFEEERRLMHEWGLDPRHVKPHLQAHASFLGDARLLGSRHGASQQENVRSLMNFCMHWLVYHILGTDQAMGRQIAAIRDGATPAAAFIVMQIELDAARSPLVKSMDHLFGILTERNQQLQDLNRTLEARVADRTRELAEANARLETMAMTDPLTGLFNRRYAMDRLEAELASAQRHRTALALVLLDADGFKAVNDNWGHDAGDVVIRTLGAELKRLFRTGDVVCRLGGDEFLVICPMSGADGAFQVAERVRAAFSGQPVAAGQGTWTGSLSVGVTALGPGRDTPEALLKAADLAVYQAKAQGRDRVVLAP